jgi:hypothetical protein
MANNNYNVTAAEKQIPVECQTDEFRVNAALKAMEAAKDHAALGRAWQRSEVLRDYLTTQYNSGDQNAWQLAKTLHRALYSCQFKIGQANADAS